MSYTKSQIVAALSPSLFDDVVNKMLDEYLLIKQHFAFRRYQPSELNGGRFAEFVVRILQHLHTSTYTPIGTSLGNGVVDGITKQIADNTSLPHSLRTIVPRFTWLLYEIRNKRDVGHVGGDVNPNFSDSMAVVHMADWILTELIRVYYKCDINTAQKIADSLNEIQVPVVAEVDGFIRVQNTTLKHPDRTLIILYHKHPAKVKDSALFQWTGYSTLNGYKKNILQKLHGDALIHYADGSCSLLPKGIVFVEKNIPMELVV